MKEKERKGKVKKRDWKKSQTEIERGLRGSKRGQESESRRVSWTHGTSSSTWTQTDCDSLSLLSFNTTFIHHPFFLVIQVQ